jgi:Spy/CpxP family protein refolding chaperone
MNRKRLATLAAIAAGFLFVGTTPGTMGAQSNAQPGMVHNPQMVPATPRIPKQGPPPDDFAGLKFTSDQQAKIDAIHKDFKSRLEAVAKDDKLNEDQKAAMTTGFHRLENGEIFKVLTPEQKQTVRENVATRKASEKAAAPPQPKMPGSK